MWINAAGEKFWVKYHFHTNQGVELTDGVNGGLAVSSLVHTGGVNAHSLSNCLQLVAGAVSIVLHNDGQHHGAGNTVGGVIDGAQGMCDGVSDAQTDIGECHTGDELTQSHALTTLSLVVNRAT